MGSFQRELSLVGTTEDLPKILTFVEACCQQAGVASGLVFDLQLAVDEACSNVIDHAYGGKGGRFTIRFETCGRDVVIMLRDHGQPFAPEQVARPDFSLPLGQRPIGGLGLHLMYQIMDDVRFNFGEDGNLLVMVKDNAVIGSGAAGQNRERDG